MVIIMNDKKITKDMLWHLFKETGAIEYISYNTTGSFYSINDSSAHLHMAESRSDGRLGFDASRSNKVYGRQADITVKNSTIRLWKRVN